MTTTPQAKILTGQKIDINSATEDELSALPFIGPKLAASIVAFRNKHGCFKNVKSIKDVKGIGSKKFKKILPFIKAEEDIRCRKP